jgi:DNA-binding NarL/FixJ family response regulator
MDSPAAKLAIRQARIVIADDFETLRRGLRSLLGPAVCAEAENGREAIQKVLEFRPDLVILDWTMPVMNGLEAATAIRSIAPNTKIIVFSLHNDSRIQQEALRAGADLFLHKTAKADVILDAISRLLQPLGLTLDSTAPGSPQPHPPN